MMGDTEVDKIKTEGRGEGENNRCKYPYRPHPLTHLTSPSRSLFSLSSTGST
jgi:hypothetical protein